MTTAIIKLQDTKKWKENKHHLQQLFTWLTGYEIKLEGSREDLVTEKLLPVFIK